MVNTAKEFAERYRSGAQGCEMEADTAQELAVEIDRLLWMAYQPESQHKPDCDCWYCIPF